MVGASVGTAKAGAGIVRRTRLETNAAWILRIGAAMVAALVWLGVQAYELNPTLAEHGLFLAAIQVGATAIKAAQDVQTCLVNTTSPTRSSATPSESSLSQIQQPEPFANSGVQNQA